MNRPKAQDSVLREPRVVAGIFLMAISVAPLIEGVFLVCFAEIGIALALAAAGWWLRKSAANLSGGGRLMLGQSGLACWLRFTTVAVPIMFLAYVLGYAVCMDRQSPTNPGGTFQHFPSSFRWAPREWVRRASIAYATPWKQATIWNLIYSPMDTLYFYLFPRTRAEEERLRVLGYYKQPVRILLHPRR